MKWKVIIWGEWGRQNEEQAHKDYLKQMKATSPLTTYTKSRLVIHKKHHWLVSDPTAMHNTYVFNVHLNLKIPKLKMQQSLQVKRTNR